MTLSASSSTTALFSSAPELRDRLLFAVPKKGRLYEYVIRLLEGIDLQFKRKTRLDIALCSNLPIALVFLPASDIPRFVGEGNVDLGISGLDVIAESQMTSKTVQLCRLGFGKCRLCVQVPVNSEIKTAQDLSGKRVVTSFMHLATEYLDGVGATGRNVSYISGSVEAACALGLADAIVDLVESGETMRAHNLVEVSTILESEAVLFSNPRSPHASLITLLNARIMGFLAAGKHVLVKYNVERDRLRDACRITPGNRAPTVSPLDDEKWVAVESMILKEKQSLILDELVSCGARDILVLDIHNCRV